MAPRIKSRYKYFCADKERLKDFMKAEGFIFKNSVLELDKYYIDPEFKLLESNTCIRVRTVNNKEVTVTFDGKIENISDIDVRDKRNVTTDISQRENLEKFLCDLGYYSYVEMNICKETYVKKDKEFYFTISIDSIENVGEFIDFDIYTESEDEELVNKVYYTFEEKVENMAGQRMNVKYRDYVSSFTYLNELKGDNLKRILVELDKIFVNFNSDNMEESIKDSETILNLELIEKLEAEGINVEVVYSNTDEMMVNTLKKILERIGYAPKFMNIRTIKELAVKETFILEKQKKIDFCQAAFIILVNGKNRQ